MANIFDQYGIKEVADVTLYEIHDDGSTSPVLFLDTLKVSTIEQTAEQAEARGGKGNSPLIIWDYGKEITVTLEDALYSPASMALMFGAKDQNTGLAGEQPLVEITQVTRMEKIVVGDATTVSALLSAKGGGTIYGAVENGVGLTAFESSKSLVKGDIVYREYEATATSGHKLVIDAEHFPGTYKLVGDTYARNRKTGKDDYFQFIINQAKMSAEQTLTLEAEGDPTVFTMTMRVLRPDSGEMMELIQYSVSGN